MNLIKISLALDFLGWLNCIFILANELISLETNLIIDALTKLRRSSFSPFGSNNQEPLIVVEESEQDEKEECESRKSSPRQSLDIDSPQNPYLLSPWQDARETRKHSLPTPPCTSGITASQVRRLSERGGEGSGPSPIEQAFLATLSQSTAPQPGGRRHSVVTISKVPPTLFGRNRRESIAAVPNFSRYAWHFVCSFPLIIIPRSLAGRMLVHVAKALAQAHHQQMFAVAFTIYS